MTRRLPLATEHAFSHARQSRISEVSRFEAQLHQQRAEKTLRTTCTRGCHHCCYYPMTCSLLEGIELHHHLKGKGLWSAPLQKACVMHVGKTWALPHPVWLLSMIPCPLLQEGECLAYDARPVDCRTIWAKGDPHYCHPHRFSVETPFVDRKQVQAEVARIDDAALQRYRLVYIPLPISKALLLAEALDRGELELEELGAKLYADYQKAHQ